MSPSPPTEVEMTLVTRDEGTLPQAACGVAEQGTRASGSS